MEMAKIQADIVKTAIEVAARYHSGPSASGDLAGMIGEALTAERRRCAELTMPALTECAEYFAQRSDADCDQDGFIPNEENKLLTLVDDVVNRIKQVMPTVIIGEETIARLRSGEAVEAAGIVMFPASNLRPFSKAISSTTPQDEVKP
jgi:hypothetical protein